MAFGRKFKKLEESDVLDEADQERLHEYGIDSVEEFVSAVQTDGEAVADLLRKDEVAVNDLFQRSLDEIDPDVRAALEATAESPSDRYPMGALPPDESGAEDAGYPRSIKLASDRESDGPPEYVVSQYEES